MKRKSQQVAVSRCTQVGVAMLIVVAAVNATPRVWSAQITLESASMGPTGQGAGLPVSATNFVGWRFKITTSLAVSEVGGHLGGIDGNLFAAIVPLTAIDALPTGSPFDSAAMIPTVNFTAPPSTADIRVPLAVTLLPGSYALVVGSGQFNATGSGWIPNSQQPNIAPTTQSSYISWKKNFSNQYAWTAGTLSNVRLVVIGKEVAGPADFNQDNRIDGGDLAAWKASFLAPTVTPKADADGDGDVDGADLLAWQRTSSPASGGSTSVPEPHAATLIGLIAVFALFRRIGVPLASCQ